MPEHVCSECDGFGKCHANQKSDKENIRFIQPGEPVTIVPGTGAVGFDEELVALVTKLRSLMAEQEAIMSLIQGMSSMSVDVYRLVMADYFKIAHNLSDTKHDISALIMREFNAAPEYDLSWRYNVLPNNIVIYADQMVARVSPPNIKSF